MINFTFGNTEDNTGHIMIIGPTGCGKTNYLLNLVFTTPPKEIVIYTHTPMQSKYQAMQTYFGVLNSTDYTTKKGVKQAVEQIEDLTPKAEVKNAMLDHFNKSFQCDLVGTDNPFPFTLESPDNIVPPTEIDSNPKFVVFDDISVNSRTDQTKVKDYFAFGRNHGCKCIYLCQSYYDIPKFIRRNTRHFILFKGIEPRDIRQITSDHGCKELPERYSSQTDKDHSFCLYSRL